MERLQTDGLIGPLFHFPIYFGPFQSRNSVENFPSELCRVIHQSFLQSVFPLLFFSNDLHHSSLFNDHSSLFTVKNYPWYAFRSQLNNTDARAWMTTCQGWCLCHWDLLRDKHNISVHILLDLSTHRRVMWAVSFSFIFLLSLSILTPPPIHPQPPVSVETKHAFIYLQIYWNAWGKYRTTHLRYGETHALTISLC